MASPHASSFMCLPFGDHEEVRRAYNVYYSVCLASAAVGTLGSALFFFQVSCGVASKNISKTQKNILVFLALADLFADIGVILRSLYYLFYWEKTGHSTDPEFILSEDLAPAIGGAFIESWVLFWYLASYFWTFFFAVDIYTSKHKGKWKLYYSHIVTWLYCAVLAAAGMLALWACTPALECAVDKYCIVGHFLCTFGPILIFLISLPVFYISTLQKMEQTCKEDKYVEVREREKRQAKKKILTFIVVFYVCWLVNVVDGITLIIAHLIARGPLAPSPSFLYSPTYVYAVWLIEALVNPLQGLLNALVYGNAWQGLVQCYSAIKSKYKSKYSTYTVSYSGEYIDVDFRDGRCNIWTRKKVLSC